MLVLRKLCLGLAGVALLAALGGGMSGTRFAAELAAIIAAVALAVGLGAVPALRGYQYTAWIVAAVVAALLFPAAFLHWGRFDLRSKWLAQTVIQVVMFGMGTQMSIHDLGGVSRAPRGVLVGLICHFSVMPLVGFSLIHLYHFPHEIAAGVILIGCCSSGLASNVMAYIARSNLALSVTVTAITTLAAPFLTPLLMQALAGTLIEVKFLSLASEIVKIVIVPITAALLHDCLKHAPASSRRILFVAAALGAAYLAFLALGGWAKVTGAVGPNGQLGVSLLSFGVAAIVFGAGYHLAVQALPPIERAMPTLSMAGIVYFTIVTTAAGRDNLLKVGAILFLVSVIHNSAGYFLGYWLSRGAGLDRNSARSVAFEVGLQNGSMASGLAATMGKLGTVGLAPAIFSPWMNISGSILANYWGKHPPPPEE